MNACLRNHHMVLVLAWVTTYLTFAARRVKGAIQLSDCNNLTFNQPVVTDSTVPFTLGYSSPLKLATSPDL